MIITTAHLPPKKKVHTYIWIEVQKEKRLLCRSVGLANHWQNNHAAPTTDKRDRTARNPKCETSFAIIATPKITDSAKLATETSVVPIRLALDAGIPV